MLARSSKSARPAPAARDHALMVYDRFEQKGPLVWARNPVVPRGRA